LECSGVVFEKDLKISIRMSSYQHFGVTNYVFFSWLSVIFIQLFVLMTKKELIQLVAEVRAQLDVALATIVELREEIRVLKAGKNSQNSSIPPSVDLKRVTKSLRETSGKKTGGQIGHAGKTLEFKAIPDLIEEHKPPFCTVCGNDLGSAVSVLQEKRQVVDIPPVAAIYTEHRIFKTVCNCGAATCGTFPTQVNASMQYGPRIESMIAYMSSRQYMPFARITEYFKQVHQLAISEGTIANCLNRFYQKAEHAYQTIRTRIAGSLVVGSDETGCKINGEKHWIWVWQTHQYNYVTVSKTRGKQAIDDVFPDGLPNSILISDAWAAQLATDTKSHQLCMAHLMRDLKYLSETLKDEWSEKVKQVFNEALKLKRTLLPNDYNKENKAIQDIENRTDQLLETELDLTKEANTFKKRLIKNRDYLFKFLEYENVAPDNNSSERAIRNIKVKQKISNQFKTPKGAQIFVALRSIIDTAIKNNLNVFDTLLYISNLRAE
jgi:transposase